MAAADAADKQLPTDSRPPHAKIDPVLRNALRYSLSVREYDSLHRLVLARSPKVVQWRAPLPQQYRSSVEGSNEYTTAAIRASLRVFLATQSGLTLWDWVKARLNGRGRPQQHAAQKSPNLRLSLSLSMILLLHRLLFRFFSRFRSYLLTKDAAPFRRRNPKVSRSLTSKLAPAIGASMAGFALGVYPGDQLRISVAIYVATRSLEFSYNLLERRGLFRNKPWWWGSWMLMPLTTGQLLHSFVFDRDCFPKAYGDFILDHTPNYVQKRPSHYPTSLPWPSTNEIVDSLAEISRLKWPAFISPILFPNLATTLPPTLSIVSPITSPAHPSHTALSCATLHPSDPSCTRTLANYILSAFPAIAKFLAAIYTVFSIPKYRKFFADPTSELYLLAQKVLRTTTFLTGAIGTSWASICFFQATIPRSFLPTQRWFIGGFMGGLWAFVDRKGGKGHVMYSVRMSIDSLWKVGKKRKWWKGIKGGDVVIFVTGLAMMNIVFDSDRDAMDKGVRRCIGWLRGEELLAGGGETVALQREEKMQ